MMEVLKRFYERMASKPPEPKCERVKGCAQPDGHRGFCTVFSADPNMKVPVWKS